MTFRTYDFLQGENFEYSTYLARHFQISPHIGKTFEASHWQITSKCPETRMNVNKHNAFLAYIRMTARAYFSLEDIHVRLLSSSAINHNAHPRKHGVIKVAWDRVTADLKKHGSFYNNDSLYRCCRNIHVK